MIKSKIGFSIPIFVLCALTTESAFAEAWQRATAPTAESVKSATFGSKPTPEQTQSDTLRFGKGSSGALRGLSNVMDETNAGRWKLSGDPQKAYLHLPGGAGEVETYKYGWAQEFTLDSYGNMFLTRTYLFIFYEAGLPTYFSRTTSGICGVARVYIPAGRDADWACGSQITHVLSEHCMVPMATKENENVPCAQIGDTIAMTTDYVFGSGSSSQALRISPDMAESDAIKAAKAGGHIFKKGNKRGWGTDVLKIDDTFFLVRNGRIYARKWPQAEFPSN
ncbi:MAG: hypothetical protein ACLQVL_06230 [Terriglobia bacterium]